MTAVPEPGTAFAGYQVEAVIARGGMGVVYRATDLSLGRPVALKLIAPELAHDARFRQRFLNEPRLAASLDHPNVVPIYEAGEADGQLFLAMRYVEGSDLNTLLRQEGRLAPGRALALLAQVAGALDAAHRRGLVHRDVKPANVLVDDDDHAYLTDFGVTKRLGGVTTETGQMVGSLDYLAPEQIEGKAADGRTDAYALACVLYECLSGASPFRRESEAETLWAHMQEAYVPLLEHPALEPVLKRAFARDPGARFGSCGELIEAAANALAAGAPVRRRRRGRAALAAGLSVLAVATTAVLVARSGSDPAPDGDGVAMIGADGRPGAFTGLDSSPANIAVGEGAIWALTERGTIARIDPVTRAVQTTYRTAGRPSDLAVGGGAVWVGNGGVSPPYTTVSVSRIDPRTGRIKHTETLPDRSDDAGGLPSEGHPRIAVGPGAVWAANQDGTVSRLDPRTGRRAAIVDVGVPVRAIAAGKEGVWFLDHGDHRVVTRIDERGNRRGQKIAVGTVWLSGVAVGAGSVWVTSPDDGQLWRIKPGSSPITRTIHVGEQVTFVTFADGAVWTGSMTGLVSRIDPRTNRVTARVRLGSPQALAAGAGSAWIGIAAGAADGALPPAMCSEVASAGRTPDVLIASDLPLRSPFGDGFALAVEAIHGVLRARDFRAGRYTVGYQSCDDTHAQSGDFQVRRCAANANAYAHAARLVAVVGPFNSYCVMAEIGIANQAPGGPLALVSPSASRPGFTRGAPLLPPDVDRTGEPGVYYPTGQRNFFRLTARDDQLGIGLTVLASQLRLRGVYVIHDPSAWPTVGWVEPFERAAERLGVRIAGDHVFDPESADVAALAQRVERSGADGVFLGVFGDKHGIRLLKALRSRLGRRVAIMAMEDFARIPDLIDAAGPAAYGMYVVTPQLRAEALDLTPVQRRLIAELGTAGRTEYATHWIQATEIVLDAIARSDGTRASVLKELRETRVERGLLGSFSFDRYGDIDPVRVIIMRVTGRTPQEQRLPLVQDGAVVDRVVPIPADLSG